MVHKGTFMLWNKKDLERYVRWSNTPEGFFALNQEARLVKSLAADWPSKGRTFLEVGCGSGIFLNVLHQAGFDVTGVDNSPIMLNAARERMGDKVDLHLADAEDLPFDDDYFDYVGLFSILEFTEDPQPFLSEAVRVASKGIITLNLNRFSFFNLVKGGTASYMLGNAKWYGPMEIGRILKKVTGKKIAMVRSILLGPPSTWCKNGLYGHINGSVYAARIGAIVGTRVDLTWNPTLIPIGARTFKVPAT